MNYRRASHKGCIDSMARNVVIKSNELEISRSIKKINSSPSVLPPAKLSRIIPSW